MKLKDSIFKILFLRNFKPRMIKVFLLNKKNGQIVNELNVCNVIANHLSIDLIRKCLVHYFNIKQFNFQGGVYSPMANM